MRAVNLVSPNGIVSASGVVASSFFVGTGTGSRPALPEDPPDVPGPVEQGQVFWDAFFRVFVGHTAWFLALVLVCVGIVLIIVVLSISSREEWHLTRVVVFVCGVSVTVIGAVLAVFLFPVGVLPVD